MHPERRQKLEWIRFYDLATHPLSTKVYGKPKPTADLLLSVERVGILQPLVVNETSDGGRQLLVGNTRREVWQQLYEEKRVKSQWIPCKLVRLSPIEAERVVLESNRQRKKTKEQEAREYKESLRIEKELAKREGSPVTVAKIKAASGLTTMGRVVADRLVRVIERADDGDEKAISALERINEGGGITPAYATLRKKRNPEEVAEQNRIAREYTARFKKKGITADVTRAKSGKFHVLLKEQETDQIEVLIQCLLK